MNAEAWHAIDEICLITALLYVMIVTGYGIVWTARKLRRKNNAS